MLISTCIAIQYLYTRDGCCDPKTNYKLICHFVIWEEMYDGILCVKFFQK